MIAPLLPLLASLLAIGSVEASPSTPDFGSVLQQFASEFSTGAAQLLLAVDGVVIDVTRAAYVTVLILGVFLYFTRIHKRLGKDLITGGVVLALLSEFVFPLLVKA